MGRLSRRYGGLWPAALAAVAVVVCCAPPAMAATVPSWTAPVPMHKPDVPPVPGTRPPAGIAVPGAPPVLDRTAPAGSRDVVRGGSPTVPDPLSDLADGAIPIPEDPLRSRPAPAADPELANPLPVPEPFPGPETGRIPAPDARTATPGLPQFRDGDTAALLVPPPDPGPGREVAAPSGDEFRIVFDGRDAAELEPAEEELLTGIAARMARNQLARLQIRSYASAPDDEETTARRLSLRRAVDMRRFLIDQGVRSTRIDVRALGFADAGPVDRVDLVLVN